MGIQNIYVILKIVIFMMNQAFVNQNISPFRTFNRIFDTCIQFLIMRKILSNIRITTFLEIFSLTSKKQNNEQIKMKLSALQEIIHKLCLNKFTNNLLVHYSPNFCIYTLWGNDSIRVLKWGQNEHSWGQIFTQIIQIFFGKQIN